MPKFIIIFSEGKTTYDRKLIIWYSVNCSLIFTKYVNLYIWTCNDFYPNYLKYSNKYNY